MEKGKIISKEGERSYVVRGENGGTYKRNRVYIWPTSVPCQPEYEYEPRVPDDNTQSPVAETPATSSSPPVMVEEQQSTPDTMESKELKTTTPSTMMSNVSPRHHITHHTSPVDIYVTHLKRSSGLV